MATPAFSAWLRRGSCCGAIPSSPDALLGHEQPWAVVTPWGQLIGAVIMFWVLGFIPGYVLASILKMFGLLRVPREVELAGLDYQSQVIVVQEDREIIGVTVEAARSPAPAE